MCENSHVKQIDTRLSSNFFFLLLFFIVLFDSILLRFFRFDCCCCVEPPFLCLTDRDDSNNSSLPTPQCTYKLSKICKILFFKFITPINYLKKQKHFLRMKNRVSVNLKTECFDDIDSAVIMISVCKAAEA